MKRSLVSAYNAKNMSKPKACAQCGKSPCMCGGGMAKMAEGGMVDAERPLKSRPVGTNPELEDSKHTVSMGSAEMVDQDLTSEEDEDLMEKDSPQVSESLSLSAQIMKDRKRQKYAKGGMVKATEVDAPEEDGRETRGMNISQYDHIEDEEHDTSDANLVTQILRERRKNRKDD